MTAGNKKIFGRFSSPGQGDGTNGCEHASVAVQKSASFLRRVRNAEF
jgi:hypothetical protein